MVQHDVNVQSGSGQLVVVVPVWVLYTVLRHTGQVQVYWAVSIILSLLYILEAD